MVACILILYQKEQRRRPVVADTALPSGDPFVHTYKSKYSKVFDREKDQNELLYYITIISYCMPPSEGSHFAVLESMMKIYLYRPINQKDTTIL